MFDWQVHIPNIINSYHLCILFSKNQVIDTYYYHLIEFPATKNISDTRVSKESYLWQ
ncbi:hypothetical protein AM1_C0214 (plasmid) [Acaryochloris marina MBIC11017]|uniref:Uncharacterized protein n=1 Tax=Acaryochloris marina (strain MBIC 11017) TaxID=329726 RepID=A8ZMV0_ACAM1|nr:hypothetical protein AM1_C0214 [Acaryochloris marina MBIC11017]